MDIQKFCAIGLLSASVILFHGCGAATQNSLGGASQSITEKTTVRYSINGNGIDTTISTYNATVGETITINATIAGPEKESTGIIWFTAFTDRFSGPPSKKLPTQFACTGTSSGKVIVVATPYLKKNQNHSQIKALQTSISEAIVEPTTINIVFE